MIADRYAAASDLKPGSLLRIWRSIPLDRREAIGVKLLGNLLAELVADDDDLISTEPERDAACAQSQDNFQELCDIAQAALPQVLWHYPEGFRYEAHDDEGSLIGVVDDVGDDVYQFTPASDDEPLGAAVEGSPQACLPNHIRQAVADGGWFGAVLPDGRRYPDEFRPVDDGVKLPGTPRRRPRTAPITGGQFSSQV